MPDSEIISIAILGKEGYEFVWAPDRTYPTTGRRLVTVKFKRNNMITLPTKEGCSYDNLNLNRVQPNSPVSLVLEQRDSTLHEIGNQS